MPARHWIIVATLAFLTLGVSGPAAAQGPVVPTPASPDLDKVLSLTPLRIDVVLQRYSAANEPLGRLPFALYGRADDRAATLRLGVQVPVNTGNNSISYQSVGTNIDAVISMTRDGRYRAVITVRDTSLLPADSKQPMIGGNVSIREFSTESLLVLRDGQSMEFSVGTDRTNGETIKAEVTVTALK